MRAPDRLEEPAPGRLRRGPELQAQVGIAGEERPGVAGDRERAPERGARRGVNQADGAVVKDARGASERRCDTAGPHVMVRGAVPVEEKVGRGALAERHEGERGGAAQRDRHPADVDAVVPESFDQEAAERVVADRADEAGSAAEARGGYGDVRRRAARRPDEGGRVAERPRRRGDEVDQQFAEADDIRGVSHQNV